MLQSLLFIKPKTKSLVILNNVKGVIQPVRTRNNQAVDINIKDQDSTMHLIVLRSKQSRWCGALGVLVRGAQSRALIALPTPSCTCRLQGRLTLLLGPPGCGKSRYGLAWLVADL